MGKIDWGSLVTWLVMITIGMIFWITIIKLGILIQALASLGLGFLIIYKLERS
ncbi:MAG: hypothetical protein Q4A30_00795 [Candidatus Saccharibacteria bacterium]|nr:hypothetical protein [Candidatus Saccharibacteria bacterium]